MTIGKKLVYQAHVATGTIKAAVGRATGNNRLRLEGRIEQFTANVKQAGVRARHAIKH